MRPAFLLATALALSIASVTGVRAADAAPTVPTRVAVHAARLLDVESGRMVSDPLVLIEGEKIVSVTAVATRSCVA